MSLDYVGASFQVIINNEQVSYGFSSPTGDMLEDAKIAARKSFEEFLKSTDFDQLTKSLMSECSVSLVYLAHLDMPR